MQVVKTVGANQEGTHVSPKSGSDQERAHAS